MHVDDIFKYFEGIVIGRLTRGYESMATLLPQVPVIIIFMNIITSGVSKSP